MITTRSKQGSAIGVHCVHTYAYVFRVRIILDMHMLTCTLIFPPQFLKVFNFFLIFIILYCLKTYCYIFDLCLSLKEKVFLLFRSVFKKPCFSLFHTNCLINISPYLRPLPSLGCQRENKLKQFCICLSFSLVYHKIIKYNYRFFWKGLCFSYLISALWL